MLFKCTTSHFYVSIVSCFNVFVEFIKKEEKIFKKTKKQQQQQQQNKTKKILSAALKSCS